MELSGRTISLEYVVGLMHHGENVFPRYENIEQGHIFLVCRQNRTDEIRKQPGCFTVNFII
jgi:hypothetical protein